MNPYPGDNSVIIMDNARIHHDNDLVELIEGLGCRVVFLPSYSSDYNPIEMAFSTIKSWIKHNRDFMEACNDSVYAFFTETWNSRAISIRCLYDIVEISL